MHSILEILFIAVIGFMIMRYIFLCFTEKDI